MLRPLFFKMKIHFNEEDGIFETASSRMKYQGSRSAKAASALSINVGYGQNTVSLSLSNIRFFRSRENNGFPQF